jgi:P-type Ca2+ transporter type 2C
MILFNHSIGNLFEVAVLTKSQLGYIYLFAFIPTVVVQICRFVKYDLRNK